MAALDNPSYFNLFAYLRADIIRQWYFINGAVNTIPTGFRLWLGFFSPRFMPVLLCRLAYWCYLNNITPIAKILSLLNFFLFGIEIAIRCPIGPGLFFPHTQGTVIGAWSIGENATIFQGVTLGALEIDFSYQELSRPTVCDGVIIGSGAKVLGGVTLGSGSRIGANAVVLDDVPPAKLAVGVPAKIISEKSGSYGA